MQAISTQKNIRMSPRKLRLVANMIKGLSPEESIKVLPLVRKRAAEPLGKVIKSALTNASSLGASPDKLVFKEIQIGEGPRLKRWQAVSRGQAHSITKRTSHIRVILTTDDGIQTTGRKPNKFKTKNSTVDSSRKSVSN